MDHARRAGPDWQARELGFEGSGAASMVASGISPQILKVGNKVKIIAHPPRDKSKRTAEFMGMEVNGSTIPGERVRTSAAAERTEAIHAETTLARKNDRLRARPDTQLVEQMRQTVPDRLLADAKPLGDFRVAQSSSEERQRLAFAK